MNCIKKYRIYPIIMLAIASLASCQKDGPYSNYKPVNQYDGTIYDYIKSDPQNFQYMLFVLQKAGLTQMLQQQDSLTFFLPTDESLRSAMTEYNVYRNSQGLPAASVSDIDSSSWRSILTPYLFNGEFQTTSFEGQDGLAMISMALRQMHGLAVKQNASGVTEMGSEVIQFSYPNGSKFTKDWISTNVSTSDIHAKNGVIDILESRYILGFNYFIDKAREPQNIYSETKTYASGSITFPNQTIRLWQDRVKKFTAVNANTVETEAADLLADGYGMWLTVLPDDSVNIVPAPWSANQTIEKSGPCFFDPTALSFTLNYRYQGSGGYRVINETISYIAEAAYIH